MNTVDTTPVSDIDFVPPAPRQPAKPFSWKHWQWRLGQSVIARIPPLRRRLPLYRDVASAYDEAEVQGFTETLDLPRAELCGKFRAQSDFSLDPTVTRRVNLLILRNKTVLGRTGQVVDERAETVLRFMGGHDYVTRNDFVLSPLRAVEKPEGVHFNLLGSDRGHRHLYHFMFERLKTLYYLLRLPGRPQGDIHVLVRPDLPEYQRKVLTALGEDYPFLRFTPVPAHERWRIATLVHADVAQNALPAWSDPEFLEFLRAYYMRAYGTDPGPRARRRIFISREDTKLRRFTNRGAVHAVLERHGFGIVLAARLSFREQIETFRDAAVIAGAHGAGLTNIVFAPPEAPLIEFFPCTRMKPTYLQLSLAQGRPYHWLRGGPGGKRQHFHLDPDELDRMLSRLLPVQADSE